MNPSGCEAVRTDSDSFDPCCESFPAEEWRPSLLRVIHFLFEALHPAAISGSAPLAFGSMPRRIHRPSPGAGAQIGLLHIAEGLTQLVDAAFCLFVANRASCPAFPFPGGPDLPEALRSSAIFRLS